MTDGDREIEFKLRVPGEDAFRRVAEAAGVVLGDAERQVNHYFDTADGALERRDLAIRLRREGEDWVVTAKGAGRGSGAAADRSESEAGVPGEVARAVLDGRASPLDALADRGDGALLDELRTAVGDGTLRSLGSFENLRRTAGPWRPGGVVPPVELTFEMDRTRFPGGEVHYEVEVEVPEGVREAVEERLRALWDEAGLEWRDDTPPKLARFRALGGA